MTSVRVATLWNEEDGMGSTLNSHPTTISTIESGLLLLYVRGQSSGGNPAYQRPMGVMVLQGNHTIFV